jgi:hypothetical protein
MPTAERAIREARREMRIKRCGRPVPWIPISIATVATGARPFNVDSAVSTGLFSPVFNLEILDATELAFAPRGTHVSDDR